MYFFSKDLRTLPRLFVFSSVMLCVLVMSAHQDGIFSSLSVVLYVVLIVDRVSSWWSHEYHDMRGNCAGWV